MKKFLTSNNFLYPLIFFVPVLGIFFVFREVIFEGKIFSHLDVIINFVPYYDFLSRGVGLISSSILSGFPVYVSTNSGWFNPANQTIFNFLDAVDTFRLLNISYIILAYFFSYLFMRRIKIDHFSSILGATVFIFGGQVMLWSETIIITNYYFLMPLVLFIIDMAVSSKMLKSFFLYLFLGILLGWGFLSGHVQFLIYVYTLSFAYFIFLLWNEYKNGLSKKLGLIHILFFAMTILTSFAIGLDQIRAILGFLPLTARAEGVTLDAATAYAYVPWHLVYYLLPSFKVPYISVSQSFQNYIGILPLFLFSLSFLSLKNLKNNRYFVFFGGVFLFCFVASIKYSPIAYIMHQLPFYSSFRETFRVMFIGDFALAIIIAISLGSLWENREIIYPPISIYLLWIKRIFIWAILPIIAVFTIIKIFFFSSIEDFLKNYFINNLYNETIGGFPPEHYFSIINIYLHQSIDQFYIFSSGILIFLIFGIISYLLVYNIKNFSFENFLIISIIVTVANFSFLYVHRIVGIPKVELLTQPSTSEFIKSREMGKEPFRIFSPLMDITIFNESSRCSFEDLGNWDISYQEFILRRELIEPNLTILYGLDSADGYEPYVSTRVSDIIGYAGSRFPTTDNYSISGEKISLNEKISRVVERKNIYRAMNVKYLLTLFPINDEDFKLVYSDNIGQCQSKLYIYEILNPYPRYFLTDRVIFISPEETFISQMNKLSKYKIPTILVESTKSDNLFVMDKKFVQSVIPVSNSGDKKEFVLNITRDLYFFVGEAFLPGWRAYVDGVEVELLRANYIYSAISLSSGRHNIKLEYKK